MQFDETGRDRTAAGAVIEWAACGSHTHVKATVTLKALSHEEMETMVMRVVDGVAGMRSFIAVRSGAGTMFVVRPTQGNSTIERVRGILERLAEALNLELTTVERENSDLIEDDLLETVLGVLGLPLRPMYPPYGPRRGYSPWDII